jgi:lysozyme
MVARHEQFSPNVYRDAAGFPTIGYGHKLVWGDGFNTSSRVSEPQARAVLSRDLSAAVNCVRGKVGPVLTQAQFDALVSFAFNVGCGNFGSSNLLKLVNAGRFDQAAQEFPRWIYAGGQVAQGLVYRRTEEQQLFLA